MPVKLSHKSPVKDTNQFFGALNHQVRDGTFCDVLLVCDGGQRIVGHKAILAASSPYFYNLFTATEPIDTMTNFDTTNNFDTTANPPDEGTNGVHKAVVKKVLSKKDPIKVFGIGGVKYRHVQAMVDCIYRKEIILDNPGEDFDTFIQVAQDTFGVVIDRTTFTVGNNFGTSDPLQTGSSALQVVGQPLVTGSRKGKKRGMNQAMDLSTKVGATVAAGSSSTGRLFLARGLSPVGKSSSAGRGRKLKGVRGGSSAVGDPTSAGTVPTSVGTIPSLAVTVPTSASAGNDTTKHQSLEAIRSLTAGHHGSMSTMTPGPMSPTVPMNHPFQSFVQQSWNPIYSQAMTNWTQGWNQNQIQGRYQSIFGRSRDQVTFGSEQDGTSDNGHQEGGHRHQESGHGHLPSVVKDTRVKCIWEGCKKYFRSDNSMMAHLLSTHYQVILKCPKTGCSKKCIKSGTFMNHVASHAEFIEPEVLKNHLVKVIEECKRTAEEQLEVLNGQKAGTEDVTSKVASEPVTKKRKKNSCVDLSRRPSQTSTTVSPSANVTSRSTPSGPKSVAPSGLKSSPPSLTSPSANVTSESSPSPLMFVSPRMTLSPFKSVPSASSVSSEFRAQSSDSGKKVISIRGTQVDRIEYIGSESDEQTDEEEEKIGNGSKSESRKVTSSQG